MISESLSAALLISGHEMTKPITLTMLLTYSVKTVMATTILPRDMTPKLIWKELTTMIKIVAILHTV